MAKKFISINGYISLSPRAEKCKDFYKLLTLPFVTETDMKTGEEEEKTLYQTNQRLSTILDRDISKESEKRFRLLFNE